MQQHCDCRPIGFEIDDVTTMTNNLKKFIIEGRSALGPIGITMAYSRPLLYSIELKMDCPMSIEL